MPAVKTAISIDEKLFDHANEIAKSMGISRSNFFSLAVRDYLKKLENQAMLRELNDIYSDEESESISAEKKSKHRSLVEQDTW